MAMFSKRPPSLAHLSDEAAARALSKHFGNIVKAAKELGVDRRDLRRLTWSNPAILEAAHERMELFAIVRRGEIINGFMSRVWRIRRRAIDEMFANPVLFDRSLHPALSLLAPAPRARGSHLVKTAAASEAEKARVALEHLEQEVAAERDMERAAEREREATAERALEQERAEVMDGRRLSASPIAPAMSLWPPGIRRPTRGRR